MLHLQTQTVQFRITDSRMGAALLWCEQYCVCALTGYLPRHCAFNVKAKLLFVFAFAVGLRFSQYPMPGEGANMVVSTSIAVMTADVS